MKLFKPKAKTTAATLAALLLFLFFSFLAPEHEQFIQGKIVVVQDGDTVSLLTEDNQNIRIRLSQIDAPEKNQPYGIASKKILSDLIYLKLVKVRNEEVDRYGRIVGTIYFNDIDINEEMVRQGAAWAYTRYAYDLSLFEIEKEAQDSKRGLWALPEKDRIPPWDWRRGKRSLD